MTPKQERFCEEYLVDLNATQAAIRAGYSKKTAKDIACQNLAKLYIQRRVAKLKAQRSKRTEVKVDDVVKELAIVAFSDLAELLEIEEGGLIIAKKFDEIPEGKTRGLKAIKEDRIIRETAKGDEMVVHDRIRYETWDKLRALELLGKHLGMFIDVKVDASEGLKAIIERIITDKRPQE